MSKNLELTFYKRRFYKNDQCIYGKVLTMLIIREMPIKTLVTDDDTPTRMSKVRRFRYRVGEYMGQCNSRTADHRGNWYNHF